MPGKRGVAFGFEPLLWIMRLHRRALRCVTFAVSLTLLEQVRAAGPVIVQNESGFEGLEEATVIYFPDTNTFQNDATNFPNHVDEGGGLFRDTLRNYYSTQGWWDGDRNTTNTDRQRTEAKGITGLGHQFVDQTFEYSFDVRTNPGFFGTGHFCDFFQLKALDGNNGAPLVAGAFYKSGSTTYMRFDSDGDGRNGTVGTFSFTVGQWNHVVIRITPCQSTESIGQVTASVDGSNFVGYTSSSIFLTSSTEYRPKFGFYRGIGTGYGVPNGDSWFEHRTVTGFIGSRNVLTWKGGINSNTWDTGSTQNFLNGAAASAFTLADEVNFNDSTANTTVNLAGSIAPEYVRVNTTQSYTFTGAGSLTAGTLRKDGSGQLTLATNNSYTGLTDVRAGTLLVTGSVGNNSMVSIAGGTLKAGSSSALGTNSTIGTEIIGGTLDINGFNLSTEPIKVQGGGAGNAGAIVNNGPQQTSALTNVTMTGDATFGGSGRWDIRGTGAKLSTGSAAFNLTKMGSNQVSLVGASVDPALGNITINQGVLAFQTSTSSMGDPTKNITVGSGAILGFFNASNAMTKICTLNGGTIWGESGTGNQNTFAGFITLSGTGGTLDAGGGLTGGAPNSNAVLTISGNIGGSGSLTKAGPGLVTLSGSNGYTGGTTVNVGKLVLDGNFTSGASLTINSGATMQLGQSNLVLKTRSLTINGAGSLDLADGAMVVDYSGSTPLATIRSYLQQGYSNAAWSGSGLGSSRAAAIAADPFSLHKTALGYAEVSSIAVGTIPGQTIDQTSVVVRYTMLGDANLDQAIDSTDFTALASNFNLSGKNWFEGDFNYDGVVNALDFNILASNYGAMPSSPALGTLVPEPSLFIALPLMLLAGKRRRITRRPGRSGSGCPSPGIRNPETAAACCRSTHSREVESSRGSDAPRPRRYPAAIRPPYTSSVPRPTIHGACAAPQPRSGHPALAEHRGSRHPATAAPPPPLEPAPAQAWSRQLPGDEPSPPSRSVSRTHYNRVVPGQR
jgi:autotransporter-associated beta strand protein